MRTTPRHTTSNHERPLPPVQSSKSRRAAGSREREVSTHARHRWTFAPPGEKQGTGRGDCRTPTQRHTLASEPARQPLACSENAINTLRHARVRGATASAPFAVNRWRTGTEKHRRHDLRRLLLLFLTAQRPRTIPISDFRLLPALM